MSITGNWLRSVSGQLSLLASLFVGAILLAGLALTFRWFFERYARESYPPLPPSLERKLQQHATGRKKAHFEDWEANRIYGAWIDDNELDPHDHLAKSLVREHPDATLTRIQKTLAVGSPSQRERACSLLVYAIGDAKPRAVSLCRYAQQRAERRGETNLVEQATTVLTHLTES